MTPVTTEETTEDLTGQHTGQLATEDRGYNETATHGPGGPVAPPARLGRGFWVGLVLAALLVACIVVYGIHSRSSADKTLVTETRTDATPEVKVVYPSGGGASSALVLPGNTQAFVDTPIYARTSGYLKRWFFDIGAHVRKGQLMATIETPELDQQLLAAQADDKVAQANLELAKSTASRYTNLLKSNSVSKQETDVATGDQAAKEATLEASQANVGRLKQLQGFENVYAPFDGVVTARNTDIGDLITGGVNSGSSAKQLFHLDSISELRVFVSIPETYSGQIHTGSTATLTLDEYPGQVFTGTVARNASAIDPSSRTLNVEVDIPNPGDKLLPGAYVNVHFDMPTAGRNLSIPSNCVIFRSQGTQVALVRNGKVVLVPIKISADRGATVEVDSGVTREDQVIVDPSDSIATGQSVKVGAGK